MVLTVAAAVCLLVASLVWLRPAPTPEEGFLRRWLAAQRRGELSAEIQAEAAAVPTSTLVLAARRIAEPESGLTQTWRRVRALLPAAVQRRVPVPFSAGRRAMALSALMAEREHEPGVAEALLGVVTNRAAANRRIALLRLGSLPVLPPLLTHPLTTLTNEPDPVFRSEVAHALHQAWPRTAPVAAALKLLAADSNAIVRSAATAFPDDEAEIN